MIILIKWIKFQKISSKVINNINNKMSFKINKIIKWGIKIVLIIILKQITLQFKSYSQSMLHFY